MIVRDVKKVMIYMTMEKVSMWSIGNVWYIGIIQPCHNTIHHHGSESYIKKLWKK